MTKLQETEQKFKEAFSISNTKLTDKLYQELFKHVLTASPSKQVVSQVEHAKEAVLKGLLAARKDYVGDMLKYFIQKIVEEQSK